MWDLLTRHFARFPAQSRVAQALLAHGFAVRADGIFAGRVAVSDMALARAVGVDRRIIGATIETIRRTPDLARVYERLLPTCHLKDAAPALGWGAIEIVPSDARKPGILADVARVLAEHGLSIRQAIVDDPDLVEEPRLHVVTESAVPLDAIAEIRQAVGVKSVVIH
ncbi:MAG TPA: ACT domain-containing protein [Candidatus Thermoplasmatota archaeon]|nr:ACT domain-containing protein [Candidatus Thermoplasmatota archaeon]